jgi:hypothetical protein
MREILAAQLSIEAVINEFKSANATSGATICEDPIGRLEPAIGFSWIFVFACWNSPLALCLVLFALYHTPTTQQQLHLHHHIVASPLSLSYTLLHLPTPAHIHTLSLPALLCVAVCCVGRCCCGCCLVRSTASTADLSSHRQVDRSLRHRSSSSKPLLVRRCPSRCASINVINQAHSANQLVPSSFFTLPHRHCHCTRITYIIISTTFTLSCVSSLSLSLSILNSHPPIHTTYIPYHIISCIQYLTHTHML